MPPPPPPPLIRVLDFFLRISIEMYEKTIPRFLLGPPVYQKSGNLKTSLPRLFTTPSPVYSVLESSVPNTMVEDP